MLDLDCIKKGDKVYLINSWNNNEDMYYRHLEITASGKQIIKAKDVISGEMLEENIYKRTANNKDYGVTLHSPEAHIKNEALRIAEHRIKYRIECAQKNIENYADFKGYVEGRKEEIKKLEAAIPVVGEYNALCQKIRDNLTTPQRIK